MANIQTNSLISLTNLDNDCEDQPCYVHRIESPSFPIYSIGKKEFHPDSSPKPEIVEKTPATSHSDSRPKVELVYTTYR